MRDGGYEGDLELEGGEGRGVGGGSFQMGEGRSRHKRGMDTRFGGRSEGSKGGEDIRSE